jgi:AraC-like DNA-binding protein
MSPELHTHSYYELLISLEGSFFLDLSDGDCKELRSGDFCLIPPGVYHGSRPAGENSKKLALRFRYVRESKQEQRGSLYEMFHRAMKACEDVILFFEDSDMIRRIEELRRELLTQGRATREYTEVLLNQLYLILMRMLDDRLDAEAAFKQTDVEDEREQRRVRIEEFFQNYYGCSITEDHMAEMMCLSRRQLSRVLREIYGKSFRQLLIDERLHRAAQLLRITDWSVEEIALAVGYTSLSGFYSAFRQKFDMTAGEYRRQLQGKT